MNNKELWQLVEDLYFNHETESVSVDISDGEVEIRVNTFLTRDA